jgi:molybdate transport system substrate-binding protein
LALSQIAAEPAGGEGCRWEVPGDLHQPIEQQAVLLARGASNPAAVAFLDYLRGPRAAATIADFGYGAAP